MANVITVYKTTIGASKQSIAMTKGKAIQLVAFSIGNGGHNPITGNPITVDRGNTDLPGLLFGPSYNVELSIKNETTLQLKGTLLPGEASGTQISNLGVYARIISDDEYNGQEFLYAIANFSPISRTPGTITFTVEFNN